MESRIEILLVADDLEFVLAMSRRLDRACAGAAGFCLESVDSADNAKKRLAGQAFDLVLVDLAAPGCAGEGALADLSAWAKASLVVALAGPAQAFAAGAEFLRKADVDPLALQRYVARAVAARRQADARLQAEQASRAALRRQAAAVPAAARRRVLIVEDEPDFAHLLGLWLSTAGGFEVQTAGDAREGLRAAASFRPDVILLDYVMPFMDGLELCRRLRADPSRKDVPVHILTAGAPADLAERARSAGATTVMVKPFPAGELVERLRAAAG